jgi:hypothetical protein
VALTYGSTSTAALAASTAAFATSSIAAPATSAVEAESALTAALATHTVAVAIEPALTRAASEFVSAAVPAEHTVATPASPRSLHQSCNPGGANDISASSDRVPDTPQALTGGVTTREICESNRVLAAVSGGYPTLNGYPASGLTAEDLATRHAPILVKANGPEIKRMRAESSADKKRKGTNEANTAALRASMKQLDQTVNTGALVEAEKAEARRNRIAELEHQISEMQSDLSEGIAEVKERAVLAAEWRPSLQDQLKERMTSLKDDLCTMWDTMDERFDHSRRDSSEIILTLSSACTWATPLWLMVGLVFQPTHSKA